MFMKNIFTIAKYTNIVIYGVLMYGRTLEKLMEDQKPLCNRY